MAMMAAMAAMMGVEESDIEWQSSSHATSAEREAWQEKQASKLRLEACSLCAKTALEAGVAKLSRCSLCKACAYCSKACQTEAWAVHK